MSSDRKFLEDKINQLPSSSRANVRDFIEYLFEKNLNDPGFLVDIEAACRKTFNLYEQSDYATWEDLQQDLLLRFLRWLPRYSGKSDRQPLLEKIATNLLIDAARKRDPVLSYLERVDSEVSIKDPASPISPKNIYPSGKRRSRLPGSGKKLKQNWAGALREYRDQYSSLELQKKSLDWRGD